MGGSDGFRLAKLALDAYEGRGGDDDDEDDDEDDDVGTVCED